MSSLTCTECNQPLETTFRFCPYCGVVAPSAQVHTHETVATLSSDDSSPHVLVMVHPDGHPGVRYQLLESEHICGRGRGSIVIPDDDTVSPEHAAFYYRDDALHLRDLNSLNGTFIKLRPDQSILLTDKQQFICGRQLFQIACLSPIAEHVSGRADLAGTPLPAGAAFVVTHILSGGRSGTSHLLKSNTMTLSRSTPDFPIEEDTYVSQPHAQLAATKNGCLITDLNSKNGTYVRILEPIALKERDHVLVGQQVIQVIATA
jgi:pSer/pThr/pTyr-binding forkhead associated (FHA) protein